MAALLLGLTVVALLSVSYTRGQVNVDDPVEKHLPEFRGQMVVAERSADTARGRIFVWLVQHAGLPGEGWKAQDAFKKAALAACAAARPAPAIRAVPPKP